MHERPTIRTLQLIGVIVARLPDSIHFWIENADSTAVCVGGRIIQPVQVEAYLQSHNMAKILYHVLRSNNVTFALEYRARARARARARNLRVRAQNFLRALAQRARAQSARARICAQSPLCFEGLK